MRLSKIYTRTGDAGSTGLVDGSRIDFGKIASHDVGLFLRLRFISHGEARRREKSGASVRAPVGEGREERRPRSASWTRDVKERWSTVRNRVSERGRTPEIRKKWPGSQRRRRGVGGAWEGGGSGCLFSVISRFEPL